MEPASKWWVRYVIRRRNRIIAKVKTKYWSTKHKFGIRVPKYVDEALAIDKENGNTPLFRKKRRTSMQLLKLGRKDHWRKPGVAKI